jgi:hypothetical protein
MMMRSAMDLLLQEDELHIVPAEGAFDTAAIAARIGETGFSFQDEAKPEMWVVSSDEPSRDAFRERRLADPKSGFPRTLLIELRAQEVVVYPVAGYKPLRELSEQFLEWLTHSRPCRITGELGGALPAVAEHSKPEGATG